MFGLKKEDPFSKLMVIYFLWLASWTLATSLFEVYFFNLGLSLPQIFLADALWNVASILLIPLFKGFNSRTFMLAGVAVSLLSTSLLIFSPATGMAYIFRIIVGASNALFWLPFNTRYYEHSKSNNAVLGALYYAITPVLSLIAPAFGGYLASTFGFPLLYLLSIFLFGLTFLATFFLEEGKTYSYKITSSLQSISGLRSIIFMEGFTASTITGISLEVMLLLYLRNPIYFGLFTSLVTVFAVIASILTARISDKKKRRREFLLPVVLCFSLSVIFSSQAQNIWIFFIGYSLVNFFSRIFFPLPLALAVDNSKSLVDTMAAREFILNVSRLLGGLLGYIIVLYFDIRLAMLIEGLLLLLYIPVFENRKKKLSTH